MNKLHIDKTHWKKHRFGDVAIQTKEVVDIENTNLTRYVAGEHMFSEDIHLRKWGTVGDGYLGPAFIRKFSKGDILYGSRRTYLKKVAIADFDDITANTTFVIKANEDLIEPVLLAHLMLSHNFTDYSVKNSRGSVNPYINWKDIADYEFIIPKSNRPLFPKQIVHRFNSVETGGPLSVVPVPKVYRAEKVGAARQVRQGGQLQPALRVGRRQIYKHEVGQQEIMNVFTLVVAIKTYLLRTVLYGYVGPLTLL